MRICRPPSRVQTPATSPDGAIIDLAQSLAALRGLDLLHALMNAVRDRIDPWADLEVNRAIELTRARSVLRAGGPPEGADADFLCEILDHRIRHAETMALAAMTALGAPAAGGVIRRSLGSADPDVRAQAIEDGRSPD